MQTLEPILFEKLVQHALEEDLGRRGDITTQALLTGSHTITATMRSREEGVFCGGIIAKRAFEILDPEASVNILVNDGQVISPGIEVMSITGNARAVLAAERVALNFCSHLSGIASTTQRFVQSISHTKAKITCTRKTLPGLRLVQKFAISCGGGVNHRFGLDDAILIKDNHIQAVGGVAEALRRAKKSAGHLVKIEIEVDTLAQLETVLSEGADAVLLDNMSLAELKNAVKMINGRMISEASGGVTLESVAGIAQTGVDYISCGALTHSVKVLDLGLDMG